MLEKIIRGYVMKHLMTGPRVGNRSFRQRVSSPTYEVDSPTSNVSSPTLVCQLLIREPTSKILSPLARQWMKERGIIDMRVKAKSGPVFCSLVSRVGELVVQVNVANTY